MTSGPGFADWYPWADTGELDAVCISVIRGAVLADVLGVLGADVASVHETDFESALPEWYLDAMPIQAGRLGDALVLVEPNGWAASMPEAVEAVSAGGLAVSVSTG